MFLLYSMDISGIQNFIYTVGESGVLKGLRARSFYLEIMMEHVVDELLEKLALSRAKFDLYRWWSLLHAFTEYRTCKK